MSKAKLEMAYRSLAATEAREALLKLRIERLEGLLREVVALDPRGEFLGWNLDGKIDAALANQAE